jgi:hypothetical protein
MKRRETTKNPSKEIAAMSTVFDALSALDASAQRRVISYVEGMLGLVQAHDNSGRAKDDPEYPPIISASDKVVKSAVEPVENDAMHELDGISPVAQKWMRRNGLTANQLSSIFSLGVDEIDLVAKAVPGKNKKDRMRSLCLLRGVSAYLGSGVARFTHEQLKETCLHYDAYDSANFAAHLKGFTAEVSGSKESGYTLTARGITNATDMVKQMSSLPKEG